VVIASLKNHQLKKPSVTRREAFLFARDYTVSIICVLPSDFVTMAKEMTLSLHDKNKKQQHAE